MNILRLRGWFEAEPVEKRGAASLIRLHRLRTMAELVMADHEALVKLLAHSVPLEPPLKALHSFFPFVVLLVLLARPGNEAKEFAAQTLAYERNPGLPCVSREEVPIV